MKVILVPQKGSCYYQHVYKTFETDEAQCTRKIFSVRIEGVSVDFLPKEVRVVDFEKEMQETFDNLNWYGNPEYHKKYALLREYQKVSGIMFVPHHKTFS